MDMGLTQQEYQKMVQARAEKSPLVKDAALAFLTGGAICTLGQAILEAGLRAGLPRAEASSLTTISLVGLSVLLTGLNLYNKLARFGGAGTLVPVTGFANAMAAPAIDFKSEGLVTGMAARVFTVAGPVLVYGTVASAVYGLILLLL